jgi:hypothetical protein
MSPDPGQMASIAAPLDTVSDKIRALDAAGYARADIARFLGKRYQHVRNVLVDDSQRAGSGYVLGRADLSGVREGPAPLGRDDDREFIESRGGGAFRLVVRPDGSILLPREVAEVLNGEPGRPVMARLEGKTFVLASTATAMEEAQEILRRYIPDGRGMVDKFLAKRRAMWGEADDNG